MYECMVCTASWVGARKIAGHCLFSTSSSCKTAITEPSDLPAPDFCSCYDVTPLQTRLHNPLLNNQRPLEPVGVHTAEHFSPQPHVIEASMRCQAPNT